MASLVTVDDRDSRIHYLGPWEASGSPFEFDGTTHGIRALATTVVGNATFSFTGTSIAVFGTIAPADFNPNTSVSTYSVDGSPLVTFIPNPPTTATFRQPFYQSPNLTDGDHVLDISITAFQSALWIDYLQYMPSLSDNCTNTGTPTCPPTMTATQNSSTSSKSSNVPAGAIAGGVIGGLVVALLALLFLVWRCKLKKADESSSPKPGLLGSPVASTTVTPFDMSEPSISVTLNGGFQGSVSLYDTSATGPSFQGFPVHTPKMSQARGMPYPQPDPSVISSSSFTSLRLSRGTGTISNHDVDEFPPTYRESVANGKGAFLPTNAP